MLELKTMNDRIQPAEEVNIFPELIAAYVSSTDLDRQCKSSPLHGTSPRVATANQLLSLND